MGLFSSRRERRLWLWALAVVALIFASLGFSGRLVDLLGNDNVAAGAFGLALLLVAATILTDGLQSKPTHIEMAVAFGIAAVILMALLRLTLAERSHLIEYGVLAVFIHAALTERAEQGRRVRLPGARRHPDHRGCDRSRRRTHPARAAGPSVRSGRHAVQRAGRSSARSWPAWCSPGCGAACEPEPLSPTPQSATPGQPADAEARRPAPPPASRPRPAPSSGSPHWPASPPRREGA